MTDSPRYESLRDYLRVLKDHRILIVLVGVVFAGAAYGLSKTQSATYRTQASVAFVDISQIANLISNNPVPSTTTPTTDPQIEAETISRSNITRVVDQILGPSAAAQSGSSAISAFVENSTNLLVIQAESTNALLAARLANAYAQAERLVTRTDLRSQLRSSISTLTAQYNRLPPSQRDPGTASNYADRLTRLRFLAQTADPVQIVNTASVPTSPISPQPLRNSLLALLVGVTLGILAAFVRDALDRRLRASTDIAESLGWPILGNVREQALGQVGLISVNGRRPSSDVDFEDFRILRKNLQFLDRDKPLRSIVVTSALAGEGKTTVAASLACASAAAGRLTLLVECDLRRPSLAEKMGISRTPGLTDYLTGEAQPADILQTVPMSAPQRNGARRFLPWSEASEGDASAKGPATLVMPRTESIVVITAGSRKPNSAELLGSDEFGRFLSSVTEAYDFVVLDSSPMLSVADTLELVPQVEGLLVCVRASKTTLDEAHALKTSVERLPSRPVGVIVTGVRPGSEDSFYYYSSASA